MVDVGEELVGSYFSIVHNAIVAYNVRYKSCYELDVVAIDSIGKTAYIVEVTSHMQGVLYKNKKKTIEKIIAKHEVQKAFAKEYLTNLYVDVSFQFWTISMSVPIKRELQKLCPDLQIISNKDYSLRIKELVEKANSTTYNSGNSSFRLLQILGHLK